MMFDMLEMFDILVAQALIAAVVVAWHDEHGAMMCSSAPASRRLERWLSRWR